MTSKGNHVKFARFVLLAISEEADFHFYFVQCIIKPNIIRFHFSDIQNNRGLGKSYQPQPSTSADNP